MNTSEVFHLWANQSRNSAKSGNVFFEGPTIYSYGYHFPIATLKTLEDGTPIALFNPDRYSVTTAKHKSKAQGAVHSRTRHDIDSRRWGSVNGRADLERELAAQAVINAKKTDYAKQEKREAAKRARERKKLDAMDILERAEKWRSREVGSMPYDAPVFLRLNTEGTRIETSKGAQVPVAAAKRAWPLIRAGQSDPAFAWENYNGFAVRDGKLVIGCHAIPLPEVERMAAELKIA